METPDPSPSSPAPTPTTEPGESLVSLLLTLLSLLNKRTLAFAAHLLPLIALGSGFWLWWSILPNPTILQLVGVGTYALFMLSILWVRR